LIYLNIRKISAVPVPSLVKEEGSFLVNVYGVKLP